MQRAIPVPIKTLLLNKKVKEGDIFLWKGDYHRKYIGRITSDGMITCNKYRD